MHDPGRSHRRRQHRCAQEYPHVRVVQRDIEGVVDDGALTLDANVGADRVRDAEQQQRLIE